MMRHKISKLLLSITFLFSVSNFKSYSCDNEEQPPPAKRHKVNSYPSYAVSHKILPNEIWYQIISNLDDESFLKFRLLSHRFIGLVYQAQDKRCDLLSRDFRDLYAFSDHFLARDDFYNPEQVGLKMQVSLKLECNSLEEDYDDADITLQELMTPEKISYLTKLGFDCHPDSQTPYQIVELLSGLLKTNTTLISFALDQCHVYRSNSGYCDENQDDEDQIKCKVTSDECLRHKCIGQEMGSMLTTNTTLISLKLRSDNINEHGALYLAQGLHNNKTLKILSLYGNQISDKGCEEIGRTLQSNTTLTKLDLSENNISSEGFKALSDGMKNNTTLKKLNLSSNRLDYRCLEYFIQNNMTLTELNLAYNSLNLRDARSLVHVLQQYKTLEQLSLTKNRIDGDIIRELAQILTLNSSLKILDLGENAISATSCEEIAQALHHNSALLKLNLFGNDIGDKGAQALSKALQNNFSLRHLNLGDNKITDEGALVLAAALEKNNIVELGLTDNNISYIGGEKIESMPFSKRINLSYPYK